MTYEEAYDWIQGKQLQYDEERWYRPGVIRDAERSLAGARDKALNWLKDNHDDESEEDVVPDDELEAVFDEAQTDYYY